MGPRSEKLVFNSVLNFRRVTYFCLLETQKVVDKEKDNIQLKENLPV